MLLDQVDIGVLNDLSRVTQHLDAPFDTSYRLRDVVKVRITGLATRLLAYLLETRQVKKGVFQFFEVELELMRTSITNLLNAEQLLQKLV